jgi:hypothetical protein
MERSRPAPGNDREKPGWPQQRIAPDDRHRRCRSRRTAAWPSDYMDRGDGTAVNGTQPAGRRPVMGTGAGIALLAVGAILRFAVATTSTHGLNVHIVGVILMLAGALGLLLTLLVWGPLNPARRRRNSPGGYGAGAPPQDEEPRFHQDRPLYRDQRPQ